MDSLLALDIETTGLDPATDRVLAVALASSISREIVMDSDERELLRKAERIIESFPSATTLVTWNGEAFDLPFLAARFKANDVPTTLSLRDRAELGKYGNPRFEAEWDGRRHVDIAYIYRVHAESKAISWSLKPVARSFGLDPVEVDRSGAAISGMSREDLQRYVTSDADVTLALARRVLLGPTPAVR